VNGLGCLTDDDDQFEDLTLEMHPSQTLPYDELAQQLKDMQDRESALTQTMNELTKANTQLEISLQEARLKFQEQDSKWKTKWDRREKIMLNSFEKQIDAHATAVVAAAAEAAEETEQRVQQRYE